MIDHFFFSSNKNSIEKKINVKRLVGYMFDTRVIHDMKNFCALFSETILYLINNKQPTDANSIVQDNKNIEVWLFLLFFYLDEIFDELENTKINLIAIPFTITVALSLSISTADLIFAFGKTLL